MRGKKTFNIIMLSVFIVLITISFVSAGFFSDFWGKITGRATNPLDINITVGAGTAPNIYNISIATYTVTLQEGPSNTNISVNFSVVDVDGAGNLDSATAQVNITDYTTTRSASVCAQYESSGDFANYTCNISVFWFDTSSPNWVVNITILDQSGNRNSNDSANITINSLTGFNIGPSNLSWSTLNAGSNNQTATTGLTINNTGNQAIGNGSISVNATSLEGEVTSSQGIYSGNFSVGNFTSGSNECFVNVNATRMNATSGASFNAIGGTFLNVGNYTLDDGTAQEVLYFCILEIGSELSQQSYSTDSLGTWGIQIT